MRRGAAGRRARSATATFWICEEQFGLEFVRQAYCDIEGHDALCVRDLDRGTLPRFISVESECVADGETLTPARAVAMLDLLREAGYTRFKLVSQDDFRTVAHPDRWRWLRRLVDTARATYLALRHEYFNRPGVKTYSFWFDWHATHDRDAPASPTFPIRTSTIFSEEFGLNFATYGPSRPNNGQKGKFLLFVSTCRARS